MRKFATESAEKCHKSLSEAQSSDNLHVSRLWRLRNLNFVYLRHMVVCKLRYIEKAR